MASVSLDIVGETEGRSKEVAGGDMEERLKQAAKAGDIHSLYEILKQDPEVLENIDRIPFSDTPLHIAASMGRTDFGLEILRLKPSFGRKLNPDGHSPLELALREGHDDTVRKLIKYDSRLVRVQRREGFTALHLAAECNKAYLLAEFLLTCPASVKDTTIHGETAVHIAIRKPSLKAFNVLFGWLKRTDNIEVLNWKDNHGDTALHLAARTGQVQIIRKLVKEVSVNEKNGEGSTALDIVPEGGKDKGICRSLKRAGAKSGSSIIERETWEEFLSSPSKTLQTIHVKFDVYCEKGLSGDMRNAVLVVAVLIATATYQALLQPPGGLSQGGTPDSHVLLKGFSYSNLTGDTTITGKVVNNNGTDDGDHGPGKVVMEADYFFPFIILNSIAFAASLGMIFALLPVTTYNLMLYISLGFMFLSYICCGLVISPEYDTPYYTFQAAFGLYALITGIRLPFKVGSYEWARRLSLNLCPKGFNRRQMEREVFLTKYAFQDDIPRGACLPTAQP